MDILADYDNQIIELNKMVAGLSESLELSRHQVTTLNKLLNDIVVDIADDASTSVKIFCGTYGGINSGITLKLISDALRNEILKWSEP